MGSGFLLIAILLMMAILGWPLVENGRLSVLFSTYWNPRDQGYGILPMMLGSLRITFLALLFSLPMSIATACLTEVLAPRPLRRVLFTTIRFMAGVPTVVYGFVAVFLLVPFMREYLIYGSGFSILTASLVLAVLIAPTMIIFFVNGLQSVPRSYTRAVESLGARPMQKLLYLLLPQAYPSLLIGLILGLGRAMGDTLISLMLAGNSVALPESVAQSGRTLTGHIALVIAADFSSMEFTTIFACGLMLSFFTVCLTLSIRVLERVGNQRGGAQAMPKARKE
nr:ABC transporter permease subunit [uncultured Desulfobulbus sp.]